MLRIKDQNLVPPGGAFVYRHKVSNAEFRHHTIPHLHDMVRRHCEANGYEFTNQEFTENICANAHPMVCEEVDATGMPNIIERVRSLSKEVVSWGKHGFPLSDADLVAHRFAICSNCPHWKGSAGGTYMTGLCRLCGCSGVKLKIKTSRCPESRW